MNRTSWTARLDLRSEIGVRLRSQLRLDWLVESMPRSIVERLSLPRVIPSMAKTHRLIASLPFFCFDSLIEADAIRPAQQKNAMKQRNEVSRRRLSEDELYVGSRDFVFMPRIRADRNETMTTHKSSKVQTKKSKIIQKESA
jgi:hypothetical protein